MKIEVLLFAQLRESLGTSRTVLELEEGQTVRDVAHRLMAQAGKPDVGSLPLRFAVNEEFVEEDHRLIDGDRVAVLTPVSGG
ncbi:MAG: MoaD/ThiS family protein [Candidatus Krumholzibacteria bacterium]|nr:MoaD/ThiS family protein [Candidatus Krumholzibacteria bacterium]